MATRRIIFLDPDGDTAQSDWVGVGDSPDVDCVSKGVRQPTAPSTASYIESTTHFAISRYTFPTPSLNSNETVDYLRVWVYATTQANHTITFTPEYDSSGTPTGFGGVAPQVIPASQANGWFSTAKLGPHKASGDGYAHVDAADLASLTVHVGLNEGGAQAATSKGFEIYMELGVSTMERVESTGTEIREWKSRIPYKMWGLQMNVDQFTHWWNDPAVARTHVERLRRWGANTIRVHLELKSTMSSQTTPNSLSLIAFENFLDLCTDLDMRVLVAGPNTFLAANRPGGAATFDALGETDRRLWFANFWGQVARSCAASPCVMGYDLMNESLVPGGVVSTWYVGSAINGYDFVTWLVKDRGARTDDDVLVEWVDQMTTEIRKYDPVRMIGMGFIIQGEPFISNPDLFDVMQAHIYPGAGTVPAKIAEIRQWKTLSSGKPVVTTESGNFAGSSPGETVDFFLALGRAGDGGLTTYNGGDELTPVPNYPEDQPRLVQLFIRASPGVTGRCVEHGRVGGVAATGPRIGQRAI